MMKKTIFLIVIGLLVLALGVSMVSAATTTTANVPFGRNQANLTDAQKQELTPLFNQLTDLQKQMWQVRQQVIQKQVTFGNLTQAQADQATTWMQQRAANGFGPGYGPFGQQPGASITTANVPSGQNQAKLTDAQKQELTPLLNQLTDLQKQMWQVRQQIIQKQVTFGNLTQAQADQATTWMQQRAANGFGPGNGPGYGRGGRGFGPFGQQQQSAGQ